MSDLPDPQDLRDSVRDYRNPNTTEDERAIIRFYWDQHDIPNQTAAMLWAEAIEKTTATALGEEGR